MGIKSRGKAGVAKAEEGGNDFDGEEEVGGEGEDDERGGEGSVSEVVSCFKCVTGARQFGRMGCIVPFWGRGRWGAGKEGFGRDVEIQRGPAS